MVGRNAFVADGAPGRLAIASRSSAVPVMKSRPNAPWMWRSTKPGTRSPFRTRRSLGSIAIVARSTAYFAEALGTQGGRRREGSWSEGVAARVAQDAAVDLQHGQLGEDGARVEAGPLDDPLGVGRLGAEGRDDPLGVALAAVRPASPRRARSRGSSRIWSGW